MTDDWLTSTLSTVPRWQIGQTRDSAGRFAGTGLVRVQQLEPAPPPAEPRPTTPTLVQGVRSETVQPGDWLINVVHHGYDI